MTRSPAVYTASKKGITVMKYIAPEAKQVNLLANNIILASAGYDYDLHFSEYQVSGEWKGTWNNN